MVLLQFYYLHISSSIQYSILYTVLTASTTPIPNQKPIISSAAKRLHSPNSIILVHFAFTLTLLCLFSLLCFSPSMIVLSQNLTLFDLLWILYSYLLWALLHLFSLLCFSPSMIVLSQNLTLFDFSGALRPGSLTQMVILILNGNDFFNHLQIRHLDITFA